MQMKSARQLRSFQSDRCVKPTAREIPWLVSGPFFCNLQEVLTNHFEPSIACPWFLLPNDSDDLQDTISEKSGDFKVWTPFNARGLAKSAQLFGQNGQRSWLCKANLSINISINAILIYIYIYICVYIYIYISPTNLENQEELRSEALRNSSNL